MPGQLARLLGFVAAPDRRSSIGGALIESCLSDEVSEYDGVLLVRLGAGRAMQVRLRESEVLTRTVPIANAMQIGEHPPWQLAPASCVLEWIQSNAAIWQWLVAKGADAGAIKSRLAEAMLSGHNAVPV
jgi:hypothetical protein